jgi:hypothetical protein
MEFGELSVIQPVREERNWHEENTISHFFKENFPTFCIFAFIVMYNETGSKIFAIIILAGIA